AAGVAAIQFELLLGTILLLNRKGVRHALLRTPQERREHGHNTTFSRCRVGEPRLQSDTQLAHLRISSSAWIPGTVTMYALAVLLELACEPVHNRSVIELKTAVRVRAKGLGVGAKSLMTFLILFYDSRLSTKPPGYFTLFAFAGGQMAYSIVLFVTDAYSYPDTLSRFHLMKLWCALRRNSVGAYFDLPLLKLSMILNEQFVLKHILTEGDKVVLSCYIPMAEQGGYALAANYGSLIARLVFQPIEETSRVFFAKTLSATPGQSAPKTIKDESASDEQQNSISLPALKQAAAFLSSILQTQLFLAMPIIAFGHVYLPIVLSFLLPARFLATSAPQRLYAWVYYLPVFAVNGVLEAFVAGTATARDVMMLFSVIYISAAIALYQIGYGDVSLVYAKIVGLSMRILYVALFASNYFHCTLTSTSSTRPRLLTRHNILPDARLLLTCATAQGIVTYGPRRRRIAQRVAAVMLGQQSKMYLLSQPVVVHVGLGGVLALACLATCRCAQGGIWRFCGCGGRRGRGTRKRNDIYGLRFGIGSCFVRPCSLFPVDAISEALFDGT
ncbi:hypothetical protein PLEOSDRAFT_1051491, partial [Pleurotus ostreatus PC15]